MIGPGENAGVWLLSINGQYSFRQVDSENVG